MQDILFKVRAVVLTLMLLRLYCFKNRISNYVRICFNVSAFVVSST